MKVMFMGTPDFAVPCLDAILEEHMVVCAVTQPDKPKGRGYKLMPPPVKEYALKQGIPVLQPDGLKDGGFVNELDQYDPDVIVVVAYGKILPEYILNYPKYGCINVHASLLPKYRGAAPIQWAIINGEKESGVCTMKMEKGLDTGAVYESTIVPIENGMTAGQLHDSLMTEGAKLIVSTLNNIDNLILHPQDHELSTYAAMITKETARIDWNRPAEDIVNLINGMNPVPLAHTSYNGEMIKIIKGKSGERTGTPGEILGLEKGVGLWVACSKGAVCIMEIKPGGSKSMGIEDYLRGHTLTGGFDK